MKIAILSYKDSAERVNIEERRLRDAAKLLGHKAQIFRVDKCQMLYESGSTKVLYKGKLFPKCDVLIPRVSILRNIDLNVSIIKQFQLMKMPVVNGYLPAARAKNKLRTMQILDNGGIKVPKTVVIKGEEYLDAAVKAVGGTPVIIKTTTGSFGSGVVIAESKRAAHSAWDAISGSATGKMVLIQEFIKESKGKDVRVFVVGGRVVGAMERCAKKGEFRSNLELGGSSKALDVERDMARIAIKATKLLGLSVAGVDIIMTKTGPAVMEVNCNPGFKGLEEATGRDIAAEIIKYSVNYAKRYYGRKRIVSYRDVVLSG